MDTKVLARGEVALDAISEEVATTEGPVLELSRWDVKCLLAYTRALRAELWESNLD